MTVAGLRWALDLVKGGIFSDHLLTLILMRVPCLLCSVSLGQGGQSILFGHLCLPIALQPDNGFPELIFPNSGFTAQPGLSGSDLEASLLNRTNFSVPG